jgi:hypothetical protein
MLSMKIKSICTILYFYGIINHMVEVSARLAYGEQLALRRAGLASDLPSDASWEETKPHFYADAHQLIDNVREQYAAVRENNPPYGLVDIQGQPFTGTMSGRPLTWIGLEVLLIGTARAAFEKAEPPVTGCPYHEALSNIGGLPSYQPVTGHGEGNDRLATITYPGAYFAPLTIIGFLRKVPAIGDMLSATVDPETLAKNSSHTFLEQPLNHAQQHAKAFSLAIADGYFDDKGNSGVDRNTFFPEDVVHDFLALGENRRGQEAIVWSKPTTDLILRTAVLVADRTKGSEDDLNGGHQVLYPAGTRLGDIEVTEPTIRCPGSQMTYDLYKHALTTIVDLAMWTHAR